MSKEQLKQVEAMLDRLETQIIFAIDDYERLEPHLKELKKLIRELKTPYRAEKK